MAASRRTAVERREPRAKKASGGHPEVVRIWLLGGFRISVGDRSIGHSGWRLKKAANLIKLLALSPGHKLHREQVMEALWPGQGPEATANNLHQALYVARRTLEPEAPTSSYLWLQGEQISLCPDGSLWIDVEAFEDAAAEARRVWDPAAYRTALELYTGELLPEDRYEDWAEERREGLRRVHLSLLTELAKLYEERQDYGSAIETLRLATEEEPTHEDLHVELMRLYALDKRPGEALKQYGRLERALSQKLSTGPGPTSRRLHEEILAGRFPPPLAGSPSKEVVDTETALHNLPVPRTSFIGRGRELVEVKRALAMTRLLTLTGAGGSGKTRLALEVARDLVGSYPGGVWLVELAPLLEEAFVPHAVAAAVGAREQPGRALSETLIDALKEKKTLLILDNCEHLVEGAALLVDTLLSSCPEVRVLATSREPLGVPGETNWTVPSLSVPDPEHPPAVEELEGYESARLFVERALYRPSAFMLTPENARAVAEICAQLEGIPLAIELAAARVGALAVEQISARLSDSLKLLTGGARTATPRQQTLRGTLEWGHNLLTEPERKLFGRLSVFAGGWTLEAAEAVGAGDGIEEEDILDLLSRLVDKSLVVTETTGNSGLRYRMLEPVRQYAREKLEESGEAEATRRRHAAFFLALAEEAEPELGGSDDVAWFERLEREHDNLRAALRGALDRGDLEPGLRIGGAIWRFWHTRGHLSEGRRWLEEALAQPGTASVPAGAKALRGAGALAWAQGDYARSETLFEECLTLRRELGDKQGIAEALNGLANVAMDLGEYARARALFEESLALRREVRDSDGIGSALTNLGSVAYYQGDYPQATAFWEESLTVHLEIGEKYGMAISLNNLGEVAREQGDYPQATALGKESLTLFRELGDKWSIFHSLIGLGRLAVAQDNNERAARLFGAAESLRKAIGSALSPVESPDYDRSVAAVRSALGDEAFAALWAKGNSMSLEEAVEYALESEETAPTTDPKRPLAGTQPAVLTRREEEIAGLIARGMTNRQIASELTLSERTVDTHVNRIFKKLGIGSRDRIAARLAEHPLRSD